MSASERGEMRRREARSLSFAMAGNLVMALIGLVAGLVANSSAVLLDGLFSLVGFAAAYLGRRIGLRHDTPPDRIRPFGYAADEAIFATFRSLSLLGLILFAIVNAFATIVSYIGGAPPEPLVFGPMIAYFAVVGAICTALWASHAIAWRRSGRQSTILRLEMRAALFDGVITAAAGVGLCAIYLLRDGVLAPIAPIGDALIVLVLCAAAVGIYIREFQDGLRELAGASAVPRHLATARRALRPAIAQDGGILRDLSVVKVGRTFLITAYYDPGRPVLAHEVDALNLRMIHDARARLAGADVLLLVTEQPRRWPEALDPARQ